MTVSSDQPEHAPVVLMGTGSEVGVANQAGIRVRLVSMSVLDQLAEHDRSPRHAGSVA